MKGNIWDIITKILDGSASDNDISIFENWILESDDHEVLFNEVKKIWHESSFASNLDYIDSAKAWKNVAIRTTGDSGNHKIQELNTKKNISVKKPRNKLPVAASVTTIAAILILGVLFLFHSLNNNNTPRISFHEVHVPKGNRSFLKLPDGSQIWINSDSYIKYPDHFSSDKRKVLLEGEAYFDIAKNKELPFIVSTKGFQIKVLGTAFNVSSYATDDFYETTIIEGQVEVESQVLKQKGSTEKILLKPKQRLFFDKKQKKVVVDSVDVDIYTSWKEGIIHFQNQRFDHIAKKLGRVYNYNIYIEDEQLKSFRYTGKFNLNESIKSVMEVIALTTPIKLKINENEIFIQLKD